MDNINITKIDGEYKGKNFVLKTGHTWDSKRGSKSFCLLYILPNNILMLKEWSIGEPEVRYESIERLLKYYKLHEIEKNRN